MRISTAFFIALISFFVVECSAATSADDKSADLKSEMIELKDDFGKESPEVWNERLMGVLRSVNEFQKSPETYESNKTTLDSLQKGYDFLKPKSDGVHKDELPFWPGHHIEQEYKNGKPNGYWKRFDENGRLIAEGQNKDGQEVGVTTGYYPSGAVKLKQFVVTDKGHSEYRESDNVKEWYFENGPLRKVEIVRDGGRSTITRQFYLSGSLELERTVELLKGYSANDAVIKETVFDERGKLYTGSKKFYADDNGRLASEAEYADGVLDGQVKFFGVNGEIVVLQQYRAGKRISSDVVKRKDIND